MHRFFRVGPGLLSTLSLPSSTPPIGTRSKDKEERIIVKPPALLVELGVLQADDRWHVRKALYGLPTSPRDWGDYRDKEFRTLSVLCEGTSYALFQSKSDESLWLVQPVDQQGKGVISGLLVVYVDDLAFFGPVGLCQCFIEQVQKKWKTSPPSWFGEDPVTFCGAEVVRSERGYRLTQVSYLQELLQRYEIEGTAAAPMTKWTEPLEVPGVPDVNLVKEAQGITGALLWMSTRSRPDIAYAVSRTGQQATKVPDLSIAIGKQVLQYLNSTLGYGIEYLYKAGPYFSEHGQLMMPRQDDILEVYSDASHSPCGGRSVQCCVIAWRGSPLAWESARQSFTTLSSAEAELVSMIHSVQLAESVQPLVDELIADDSLISLLADNSAAVRSFEAAPAGWRNRHLRMRAQAGRERIECNLLKVSHLPGEFQVADLGTKPLSRSRILYLLELINVRDQPASPESIKVARVLSRLSGEAKGGFVTPEALAGLALLAGLPRASGQPNGVVESKFEWLNWASGFILMAALCLGVWWVFGHWPPGTGELEASLFPASDVQVSVVEDSSISGEGPTAEVPTQVEGQGSGSPEEFGDEDWSQAEAKLKATELHTGLTFVQRARLRRQISQGGIVDVPTFQQRYGPLPLWLTGGGAEGSNVANTVRPGAESLASVFTTFGGMLLALLGSPRVEWGRLRVCCQRFQRNAVLTLISRVRDAGALGGIPQDPNFRAIDRAAPVDDQAQWVPAILQDTGVTVQGEPHDPGAASSGQFENGSLQQQFGLDELQEALELENEGEQRGLGQVILSSSSASSVGVEGGNMLRPSHGVLESVDSEVMPQPSRAESVDSEVMPQPSRAESVDSEVMPQPSPAASVDSEVMPQPSPAASVDSEVMPQPGDTEQRSSSVDSI